MSSIASCRRYSFHWNCTSENEINWLVEDKNHKHDLLYGQAVIANIKQQKDKFRGASRSISIKTGHFGRLKMTNINLPLFWTASSTRSRVVYSRNRRSSSEPRSWPVLTTIDVFKDKVSSQSASVSYESVQFSVSWKQMSSILSRTIEAKLNGSGFCTAQRDTVGNWNERTAREANQILHIKKVMQLCKAPRQDIWLRRLQRKEKKSQIIVSLFASERL